MTDYVRLVTRWTVRNVGASIALGLVALLLGAAITSRIRFDTGFSALLPTDTPAVRQVEHIKEKAGGTSDLIVVLESLGAIDETRRLRFARRIAARLEAEPWIRRADAEYPVEFFLDRRLLLLDVDALEALEEAVQDDVHRALATARNPLFVNLQPPGEPRWANTQQVLDDASDRLRGKGVLPRDLRSHDNRYGFVRLKPMGTSFDMAEGARTLRNVDAIVQALDPAAESLRVRYSGAMPVNQDQHRTMTEDLGRASVLALVLVLVVLTAFTRQPGAPLIIALPLGLGITSTLAITTLTLGQLNLVSTFLVTALVGVGVDYGIHLFVRYLEELGQTEDRAQAMDNAVRLTFPACLTSGLTTCAAFAAMTLSDFRGFREYGQIAATGVALTLVATFLVMPPVAVLLTRRPRRLRAPRASRSVPAWAILTLGLAFTLYSVPAAFGIRYHNEFKTELRGDSEASRFQSEVVEKALGGSLNPAVVAVKNLDEARRVHAYVRASAAAGDGPFERALSLATMVPEDLDARAAALARIRATLEDLPRDGFDDDQRTHIDRYIALASVRPWRLDDVPDRIRRLLSAIDGSLLFVLIWPAGEMAEDTEIIAWARALDRLQANLSAAGVDAPVLDENRIAALVLAQIRTDGPWTVLYGFVAVLILLGLDFRSVGRVALVAGTLVVGFLWMFGLMAALGINVNVFNMAVFPTVLGIGIDNAVHLMHRYEQEGPGSVLKVVLTTGSAALLASVTTGLGFAATLVARHNGVNSMGQLAVVGFLGSLLASTIMFPAVLHALEAARPAAGKKA